MVLTNKGTGHAWGSNTYYQLGVDTKNNSEILKPTEVLIENIK